MHIELVGCTSAGKTTLTQRMLDVSRRQGIDLVLGDDFVLRRLRLMWIKNEFIRRRIMEICSVYVCLKQRKKYRPFIHFVLGMIRQAPGSWLYRASLARAVFRKIGIYEIICRRSTAQQLIWVDEGTLQAAHNLFVHVSVEKQESDLSIFARLVPLPDVVIYVKQNEPVLIERTMKRGHKRIPDCSLSNVQRFIKRAVTTFDTLVQFPMIAGKLLVIDQDQNRIITQNNPNEPFLAAALKIIHHGTEFTVGEFRSDLTYRTLS